MGKKDCFYESSYLWIFMVKTWVVITSDYIKNWSKQTCMCIVKSSFLPGSHINTFFRAMSRWGLMGEATQVSGHWWFIVCGEFKSNNKTFSGSAFLLTPFAHNSKQCQQWDLSPLQTGPLPLSCPWYTNLSFLWQNQIILEIFFYVKINPKHFYFTTNQYYSV